MQEDVLNLEIYSQELANLLKSLNIQHIYYQPGLNFDYGGDIEIDDDCVVITGTMPCGYCRCPQKPEDCIPTVLKLCHIEPDKFSETDLTPSVEAVTWIVETYDDESDPEGWAEDADEEGLIEESSFGYDRQKNAWYFRHIDYSTGEEIVEGSK